MPRVATSARFEIALKSGVKGEEEGNEAKKRTARATKSVDIIVWRRVNNSKDGVLVDMLFVSVRGDRASILDSGKCSTLIALFFIVFRPYCYTLSLLLTIIRMFRFVMASMCDLLLFQRIGIHFFPNVTRYNLGN